MSKKFITKKHDILAAVIQGKLRETIQHFERSLSVMRKNAYRANEANIGFGLGLLMGIEEHLSVVLGDKPVKRGGHHKTCATFTNDSAPCTCGYEEAREELNREEAE